MISTLSKDIVFVCSFHLLQDMAEGDSVLVVHAFVGGGASSCLVFVEWLFPPFLWL